jgi:hypothetical protein
MRSKGKAANPTPPKMEKMIQPMKSITAKMKMIAEMVNLFTASTRQHGYTNLG